MCFTMAAVAISICTPDSRASLPASASSSATPCLISSSTAPQSEITVPSNSRSFLSISCKSHGFAVAGIPFNASNAAITNLTPASIQALNGGKYLFLRRNSDTSEVL